MCKKVSGAAQNASSDTTPLTASQCKKAFRKDMTQYEEADEYCPNCDNHYVSTA